jgi:hypothetical protein
MLLKKELQARNGTPPTVDRVLMILLEKGYFDVNDAAGLEDPMHFPEKPALVFEMLQKAGGKHKIGRFVADG